MPNKNHRDTLCSVDYAFQRIGGKHKGRIIYALGGGVLRYGQLRKLITGITPKMLTQVLRELEDDRLITRTVYLEVPPRVEYALTPDAIDLLPVIAQLKAWGKQLMDRQGMAEIDYVDRSQERHRPEVISEHSTSVVQKETRYVPD